MKELYSENLFSLNYTLAAPLFEKFLYPWEILCPLSDFIKDLILTLDREIYDVEGDIAIAKSARVAKNVTLTSPCIIGERSEVRTGAFIRTSVIIGRECVVGNSCEIKNSVLFDRAQVPHFNYVGDSVLGFGAHLGAGALTSNVRLDKKEISVCGIETHRRKVGAMLADGVEVGCNAVLNPGTVIGKGCVIYPLSSPRGYVPAGSVFKHSGFFPLTEKNT